MCSLIDLQLKCPDKMMAISPKDTLYLVQSFKFSCEVIIIMNTNCSCFLYINFVIVVIIILRLSIPISLTS